MLLRRVAMVILLFFLVIGRADLLFSRRYAMTTSAALSTAEGKMTMVIPFALRTRRADLLFI